MTRALLVVMAVAFGYLVGGFVAVLHRDRDRDRDRQGDAFLVRAPDGRCWRVHGEIEHEDDALSWRTDSGPRVRVAGADWIEVARGGGVNVQGLDWRSAAATLGADLSRGLPVAESAP